MQLITIVSRSGSWQSVTSEPYEGDPQADTDGAQVMRKLRNVGVCPVCRVRCSLPCKLCAARDWVENRKRLRAAARAAADLQAGI